MRRIFLNLFLLTVTFQLSLQDMLDKIMRSDVWNCKSRRSCFLCHKKYVGQPIFLSLIFFFPVKTCGVPSIDTSEMGNRSVRLGDKVTFNCKVNKIALTFWDIITLFCVLLLPKALPVLTGLTFCCLFEV